ncbi:GIY-YIG nuclease family protein [Aspergillus saccharolyticus JOP 1030-1]|uniref:Bacteriophage T5 Orf172 DNA-binding domain-containing protein n=1 Tax=Aspergillus saccharolyticus JOP 1030-1 TaxID=1450539 RepID=A0A318ZI59_9EURO|nr:hypothetical protein BP01DRAFT_390735 [Aspergillus saccharolyticus JOP 1030-1]PYH46457.1 hypothetical protein BP01DRAFT_390735 [Aspergillus saccharolyticus JOP 1030-1]
MSTWIPFVYAQARRIWEYGLLVSGNQILVDALLPAHKDNAGAVYREPFQTPQRGSSGAGQKDYTLQEWHKQKLLHFSEACEANEAHEPFNPEEQSDRPSTPDESFSDEQYDPDFPSIVPILKKKTLNEIVTAMKGILCRRCTFENGWVYTFSVPNSEKSLFPDTTSDPSKLLVKIGKTSRYPNVREGEHRRDCQREHWKIHHTEPFKEYECVESLALNELQNKNMTFVKKCACNVRHREYFDVEEVVAFGILEFWYDWLQEYRPYTSGGTLKPFWRERLDLFTAEKSGYFKCRECKSNNNTTVNPETEACSACLRAGWEAWAKLTKFEYNFWYKISNLRYRVGEARASYSLETSAKCFLGVICLRLFFLVGCRCHQVIAAWLDDAVYAMFLTLGILFDSVITLVLFFWLCFAKGRKGLTHVHEEVNARASGSPRRTRQISEVESKPPRDSSVTPPQPPGVKVIDRPSITVTKIFENKASPTPSTLSGDTEVETESPGFPKPPKATRSHKRLNNKKSTKILGGRLEIGNGEPGMPRTQPRSRTRAAVEKRVKASASLCPLKPCKTRKVHKTSQVYKAY